MAPRGFRYRSSFSVSNGIWWAVLALLTGGGVGGWAAPDLPVLGPLVQSVIRAMAPRSQADARSADGKDKVAGKRETTSQDPRPEPSIPARPVAQSPTTSSRRIGDLVIATYNIQVFGASKLEKAWVTDVLAQVVRQFDVVAIQEVRSKDDSVLPRFVAAINADGSAYDFVIGPRLGRTSSKEQYAIVYDTTRVEIDPSSVATMNDPRDLLHREPMVARFRTRVQPPQSAFSFWLVNIHTDPDEVTQEVDVLADVFEVVRRARVDEDDVVLLGDLNANENQLGRLGRIPGITWVVSGTTTNTRRNKAYDNLVFDRQATAEYTGKWGVMDLMQVYGLTLDQALEVSDHFPVWAVFSPYEAQASGSMARVPGTTR